MHETWTAAAADRLDPEVQIELALAQMAEPARVREFVDEHRMSMSREALRAATARPDDRARRAPGPGPTA